MIYEYRTYRSMPGRQPALFERFERSTLGLFDEHGMEVVGFWQPVVGNVLNELHYMLRWQDMGQMEATWRAFSTDPRWQRVARQSEADGPLLAAVETKVLRPTPFSPDSADPACRADAPPPVTGARRPHPVNHSIG